jgi:hypothetical protein
MMGLISPFCLDRLGFQGDANGVMNAPNVSASVMQPAQVMSTSSPGNPQMFFRLASKNGVFMRKFFM